MAEKPLGEQLMDSLTQYTTEKEKEINKAALSIQKDMLNEVISQSPVQDYQHNGGVRRRIIVRRIGKSPAKWGSWEGKFSPGKLRAGWIKTDLKPKKKVKQKIYAVRNKDVPTLVHLVNFDHDLKSHGNDTGYVVHGTQYVTKVQDKGIERFGKEIENILNK